MLGPSNRSQSERDVHEHDDDQHDDAPREVKCGDANAERWHNLAHHPDRRIRQGINDLREDESESVRAPVPGKILSEVDDETYPHDKEIGEKDEVSDPRDDRNDRHGVTDTAR